MVICAGGGGIPTMYEPGTRTLVGAEVVIDKDRASALLAEELEADLFVMATDVDAVYIDFGTPQQKAIGQHDADEVREHELAGGLDGAEGRGRRRVCREDRQARRDRHARGVGRGRRRRTRGRRSVAGG